MKIRPLYLAVLLLLTNLSTFSQMLQNKDADKKVAGSKLIRLDEKNKGIKFIGLKSDYYYSDTDQPNWLNKSLGFTKKHQAKFLQKETDKKGYTHSKYQIYYKDLTVEGAVYNVHAIGGKIHSANGEYLQGQDISVTPAISEKDAFEKAVNYVKATQYLWETNNEPRPAGKLTILPVDSIYVLAYKFDIYATEPLSRQYIFVNANTGDILKAISRIHISNATGTAKTLYNGVVPITTDSYNGSYRLRETGRGNGVETYNLNHGSSYTAATDFTDANNNWTDTLDNNHAANDAHYAAEATYDYYFTKLGRNSYDNKGSKIMSYVHYSRNYNNAFWNGSCMTYGDGDGVRFLPFTPIEVVGHEITHGVTEYSAGLIYSAESGALNESFSDIFGTVIDFYKNPTKANYLMGETMSLTHTPIRSMQNPGAYGDPGTYKGTFWDLNQEVHTNSGVQNHWFYLVSEGGSGTNELGNNYTITGIGIDKAAQIAYRNLAVYLTPSSNYADARFYSIQAAIDLYGDCSAEVIAVANAWYAVGVGLPYDNAVIADFVASKVNICDTSSPVNFANRSTKANIFKWNFGDGQTDTARNPTHIFGNTGTYTVQLISQGVASCNNIDTVIKTDLIHVSSGQTPVVASCTPHTLHPGTGGIYQFTLHTIHNAGKGSSDDYKDYTCDMQTTLVEGKEYPLYILLGPTHNENISIWIDLNNNGRLDDAGELVLTKNNISVCSEKIIVPGGAAYNTPLRLRVASDYTGYPALTSCSNTNYGQIQDYTVIIQQNNTKPVANFTSDLQLLAKGDTVNFRDATLNLPATWQWSFAGGTPSSSTSKNPAVIYNTPGNYDVSLIVANANGTDTIVRKNMITVLDQLYCTSSLGGAGTCPGDINLVSIQGTTLNNTSHNNCSSINGSTYGSYPASDNTTAILTTDTAYQLSVTTSLPDIISVWIDFNQNGTFEASEWTQVATFSVPNVPSRIKISIPPTALAGKTGMRIRSRYNGNQNGAMNACTLFGSGITEDYFVTISNLPRPQNLTGAITDNTTGEVRLNWTFASPTNSLATTFSKFKIYRNGTILDSTLNTNYTCILPAYEKYIFTVKAVYNAGESAAADPVTIRWYGDPQISVTPLSFNETLMKGDSVSRSMTITNTGTGLLIFNTNQQTPLSFSTYNVTSETSGQNAGIIQNSATQDNVPPISLIKRYTNQSVSTSATRNILIMEGVSTGITPYDNVLGRMGFARVMVNNWADLSAQLANGTTWDMVIVNSYNNTATTNVLSQLETYRAQGGKLLFADWSVYNYTANPFLTGMGVSYVSNLTTPLNIAAGASTHPVLNNPYKISQINWSIDQASIDGQIVNVLPGATQIAQFAGYPNSGAIVLKNTGNSIFNAFQAVNYNKDENGNGISDIEELIANEITYLNNGSAPTWITLTPASGSLPAGQSATVTVKMNAQKLKSGQYNDTIHIASTAAEPTVNVPVSLVVIGKPNAELKANKTTTQNGNAVQFSDLSSGAPTQWKWILPGGTPSVSTAQNPLVTYSATGVYDVSLLATNAYGTDTIIKKSYITVLPKVVANFYVYSTNVIADTYVYFYNSSTNNPTSWKWTFEGGTPSTSVATNPYTVYNTSGSYSVKLVVANAGGSDSIVRTGYITVTLPPKPIPYISTDKRNITAGSYINYSDYSDNNPTSRKWTFAGGSPAVSPFSSLSVTYANPGIYDVKLVATNAGGSDSILLPGYITVTAILKPVANFNAGKTSITTASSVAFADNSANIPTSWKWTFAGGIPAVSTSSTPNVVYSTAGIYSVKLTVSNIGGSDSIQKTDYITVTTAPKPTTDFTATTTTIVPGGYSNFSDASSNNPTSWRWTFAGGTPSASTSQYQRVQYNTAGTYDVKLVTTNAGGADSITKTGYIYVGSTPTGENCANATDLSILTSPYAGTTSAYKSDFAFCSLSPSPDRIFFMDVPTGNTLNIGQTYNDFDSRHSLRVGGSCPGTTEIACVDDPDEQTHTYANTTGLTQRIYFIIGGFSGSYGNFTLSWRLSAPAKPVARFLSDVTTVSASGYVNFTDQSSGVPTSWKWYFPGSNTPTATSANPIVYYSISGTYDVKLVVANSFGKDSIVKTGYVKVGSPTKPVAAFSASSINIKTGTALNFYDYTSNYPTSWKWTFAGGTPSSATVSNPTITYNTPGLFTVKLIVANAKGTDSIIKTQYITVVSPTKPFVNFFASNRKVVAGNYVYFYDNSGYNPTAWKWTFAGGTPSSATGNNTSVTYSLPGTYSVKLVASNAGGSDSITKTGYITITTPPKPVPNFYASATTVKAGSPISFYDNSTNSPTAWKWTFTGGTPLSTTTSSTNVVYNLPGTYSVKLVVTNAGGSDSLTKTGYITITAPPKPVASFSSNTTATNTGSNVVFYDYSYNNPTSWKWTFTGATPASSTSSNPTVVYNSPGTYSVKLVVANISGSDSLIRTGYITITAALKPVASFYPNVTSSITGSSIYFNDYSTNYPTSWKWTFTGGTPSSSTSSNPTVVYHSPGTYSIKLVVSNSGGSDSITKAGYITITLPAKPVANFYTTTPNTTKGSYVYFTDNSTGTPTSWKWTFTGGTPSTSTVANPSVVYNSHGTYDVKLVVKNPYGSDSIVKTGYVNVNQFGYCTSNLGGASYCPGDISFVSIAGTTFNNTLHNNCSTSNNSTYASFPASGNTTATLRAGSTYDLSVKTIYTDIISVWIDYNRNGLFEASEWKQVATFSSAGITSKVSLTIPSTALLGTTGMRIRSCSYGNTNGAYDACSNFGSGITEDYTIAIAPDIKDFKADTTTVCNGGAIMFINYSTSVSANIAWNFGEGASPATANGAGPYLITYNTPGLKTVTLFADGTTVTKPDYIKVLKGPSLFQPSAPESYCKGNSVTISLQGSETGVYYKLYDINTNAASIQIGTGKALNWVNKKAGVYQILAFNNSNCFTSMKSTLTVLEKPVPNTPVISQAQNTLVSNTEIGNQWYSSENGLINGSVTKIYEPMQSGNYFDVVTVDGCSSASSNSINVILTGVNEMKANTSITLFPNPITNILNIKSNSEISIHKIEIRNVLGNKVQEITPANKNDLLFTIDMTKQEAGYYTVLLHTEKEVLAYKILKIR